jgi:hypothetical protein
MNNKALIGGGIRFLSIFPKFFIPFNVNGLKRRMVITDDTDIS